MKSYDEIANNVFERRDKYIANKKRKKRIILSIVTPALCCIALIASFGLLKSGFFSNNITVINSSESNSSIQDNASASNPSDNTSSQGGVILDNSLPSKPSDDTHYKPSNDTSSKTSDDTSSKPSDDTSSKPSDDTSSKPSDDTSSKPSDDTSSKPSDDTSSKPSDDTPPSIFPEWSPSIETNYFIDSIDKINFYSAKKIIDDNSLLPIGLSVNNSFTPKILLLKNNYAEYPIDRSKVFTTTMVTYFTIELNDERGFLAKKLGGTGLIEVVVTENNIDDLGQMITFKREDKYYTCFKNGGDYDPDSNKSSYEFSSHKYIESFNIVKNLEQENYKFTVHYEGSKVIGFECAPFDSATTNYVVDNVTFIENFCVVFYTKQTFTIDELEVYFKNGNDMDSF